MTSCAEPAGRPLSALAAVPLVLALAVLFLLGGGGPARAAAPTCPNADKTVDYNCPVGPTYLIPGLTDLDGWTDPAHYENIFTVDLDGDGFNELVARGIGGIEVYRFDVKLGQWTQVQVTPILSDADGWNKPQYYKTIQIVPADGAIPASLFARSKDGMVVYDYAPGQTSDSGSWTQVGASGPLADKDCFSNGKCWGDDPSYYSTIQIGDIGFGRPVSVIGRGADGLVAYTWDGSSWTKQATVPDFSDANGWNKPERYTSIHVWSNGEIVIARGQAGLLVYKFTPGQPGQPGSWKQVGTSGPFADNKCFSNGKCWSSGPEYWSTVQLAPDPGVGNPIVLGRGGDGVEMYEGATDQNGNWVWDPETLKPGPFPDADGFVKPEYYSTIQLANPGNGAGPAGIELLGRGPSGMVTYTFDRNQERWSAPIDSGQPALADDPWAKNPAYYTTITTALLPGPRGTTAVALLARGAHGVRTWRFDTGTSTWTRYQPYGNYPQVDPTAFAALNKYLGIVSGTVRTVYTDPTNEPTADQLQGYQSQIEQTCAKPPLTASPPSYSSCTPPPGATGVTPQAWTAVCNQIIAELYWARSVVDYFSTLQSTQTKLFIDQGTELPAIAAKLKLAQAKSVTAEFNYKELFSSVFDLLSLLPIPGFKQAFEFTAGALSLASAATPDLGPDGPGEFDQTYSDIANQVGTIQQQMQNALDAHRGYVLGDYGLLQDVGRLLTSQIWALKPQAALSASRQAFTLWIYEAFLPVLWDRWTVHGCDTSIGTNETCFPPPSDALGMKSYVNNAGVVDFDGLVPRQTPCNNNSFQFHCTWTDLKTQGYGDAYSTLTTPVTSACTYDGNDNGNGDSWTYGPCTLGVSPNDLFVNSPPSPWTFRNFACTVQNSIDVSQCVRVQPTSVIAGSMTGLGTGNARLSLTVQQPLGGSFDLRQATLTLGRFLNEGAGAAELVNHPNGVDATPNTLTATSGAAAVQASFATPQGESPHVMTTLSSRGGSITGLVQVTGISSFDAPQRCDPVTHTTELGTHLLVRNGVDRPVQILSIAPWQCVTDRNGAVRELRLSMR